MADKSEKTQFGKLIGCSPAMLNVYDLIGKAAPTSVTVFLIGESGTGKEPTAETIHKMSDRSTGPFIAINCGAITPELVGSALFGHERGSFTGANQAHRGYFEQASGGTLFLDEIPETTPELQVKLLRVLETGTVIPVGGKRQIPVDVRVIAATNRNPLEAVKDGILRKDLYYRLSTFPIYLPPLRERGNDIILLAEYFLSLLNQEHHTEVTFTASALEALLSLDWPGNVRELRNVVQRAYILADNCINAEHIGQNALDPSHLPQDLLHIPMGTTLREAEQKLIYATLEHFHDDKKKAADMLGISLKTLYNRLHEYRVVTE